MGVLGLLLPGLAHPDASQLAPGPWPPRAAPRGCGRLQAYTAFAECPGGQGPIANLQCTGSDPGTCPGTNQKCVQGQCWCNDDACLEGDVCVPKPCDAQARELEARVEKVESELDTMSKETANETDENELQAPAASANGAVDQATALKLEERSAKFINLPPQTGSEETIEQVVQKLKDQQKGEGPMESPMTEGLRPGLITLLREAGEDGLGATVKDFSSSLSDLVDIVHAKLPKDRIALMTTQDIPEFLRDVVIKMNEVNKTATFLRHKLAAITELSTLELGRAGAVAHARLKAGPGVPVSDGQEAEEAEAELEMQKQMADPNSEHYSPTREPPYKPEVIDDPEMIKSIYKKLDKMFRHHFGDAEEPMDARLKQDLVQATLHYMKHKPPKVNAVEAEGERGDPMTTRGAVQSVIEELRKDKAQSKPTPPRSGPSIGGVANPRLASIFAAALTAAAPPQAARSPCRAVAGAARAARRRRSAGANFL